MPNQGRAGNMTWRQFGSLARTTLALKVNKVWPWAAVRLLYGWHDGGRQWRGER